MISETSPLPAPPADCRACGACCFSPTAAYVRVMGADWTRLGVHADRVAHFIGNRAYIRMRDGHCIGLALSSSDAGARAFHCTVYEQRPQICRDLGRGSPECQAEIATKRRS